MNKYDAIKNIIKTIEPLNAEKIKQAYVYMNTLTKPVGSLGQLENIAAQVVGITNDLFPTVSPPGIVVFASDHGISEEGVSAYPKEVTAQMVSNFLQGGAAINVFSKQIGAILNIVDIGVATDIHHEKLIVNKVDYGTKNFLKERAMTKDQAIEAIRVGMIAVENILAKGAKCLIFGEMGISNTTSASALVSLVTGCSLETAVGTGTGISQEMKVKKTQIIKKALEQHNPNPSDAIDCLIKVGGFEIAGIVGAILKAAEQKVPIIIDGFICTAAALVAVTAQPHVKDYLIAAHLSKESGHQVALSYLKLEPLLDLQFRLGEGTGAALSFPLVEGATRMIRDMATFDSAGVSTESKS